MWYNGGNIIKAMDAESQEAARRAREENDDPLALARQLAKRVRVGADDAELSRILQPHAKEFRQDALKILSLEDDRRVMVESITMIHDQVDEALQFTIQSRQGDVPLPTPRVVLRSVLRTLTTPADARAILDFHEPRLIIVPDTSLGRWNDQLNEEVRVMEGAFPLVRNALYSDIERERARNTPNNIGGWSFAVTEGAQTFSPPEWDVFL